MHTKIVLVGAALTLLYMIATAAARGDIDALVLCIGGACAGAVIASSLSRAGRPATDP